MVSPIPNIQTEKQANKNRNLYIPKIEFFKSFLGSIHIIFFIIIETKVEASNQASFDVHYVV